MADYPAKELYTIEDVLSIMRILRAPGGCPWDAAQTHESIRKHLLEEAYETADAIDQGDSTHLCEELGDLLMQVVFHAEIAAGAGVFTFEDVTDTLCRKLLLRHPHVFDDLDAGDAAEALTRWEEIKHRERRQTPAEAMAELPKAFPALLRAAKVQKKAVKAGYVTPDAGQAFDAADALLQKLRHPAENASALIGELLWQCAAAAYALDVDPEEACAAAVEAHIQAYIRNETNSP
ncbi:MAG: MazG family protein [Oscillospiraceae bacterium]|jgi:tetrapyrrole methylase family protein/MazG family protein|nr:MazG family protein [Oscillospiraceae bacterium]